MLEVTFWPRHEFLTRDPSIFIWSQQINGMQFPPFSVFEEDNHCLGVVIRRSRNSWTSSANNYHIHFAQSNTSFWKRTRKLIRARTIKFLIIVRWLVVMGSGPDGLCKYHKRKFLNGMFFFSFTFDTWCPSLVKLNYHNSLSVRSFMHICRNMISKNVPFKTKIITLQKRGLIILQLFLKNARQIWKVRKAMHSCLFFSITLILWYFFLNTYFCVQRAYIKSRQEAYKKYDGQYFNLFRLVEKPHVKAEITCSLHHCTCRKYTNRKQTVARSQFRFKRIC